MALSLGGMALLPEMLQRMLMPALGWLGDKVLQACYKCA